eukprot:GHRR01022528.1.p1 GENE.GHRR01022528.1~~GHRR01022528.1.p1  ORF type:complete len:105 (-),score=8.99 GHRR01022528.1:189-503(-)
MNRCRMFLLWTCKAISIECYGVDNTASVGCMLPACQHHIDGCASPDVLSNDLPKVQMNTIITRRTTIRSLVSRAKLRTLGYGLVRWRCHCCACAYASRLMQLLC